MERKKVKLNFRFHNPNPAGVMEKALERLLIDNGVEKVHSAICETKGMEVQKKAVKKIAEQDTDIA